MRTFGLIDLLALIEAVRWTALLVVLALAFGVPLALALATARISRFAPISWLSAAFVELVQGLPLLGLLFFFFFGLPVFLGIDVPALVAVTVAYALYTAAFLGDIWRGGLQAIRQAQWEAGACLGLSTWHQFRYIIAPQALRISTPPTVGFLVQLIKGTSLASILGFVELARAGQVTSAATFQPLLSYGIVAAIYFALCLPLTVWSRSLEAQLNGAH